MDSVACTEPKYDFVIHRGTQPARFNHVLTSPVDSIIIHQPLDTAIYVAFDLSILFAFVLSTMTQGPLGFDVLKFKFHGYSRVFFQVQSLFLTILPERSVRNHLGEHNDKDGEQL